MKRVKGAALVIVLFIVALAASLAVEMSANLLTQVQKSSDLQDYQQAKWYAYAAEELAKKVLLDSNKDSPNKTSLDQAWAHQSETPYPVENGLIGGQIVDLQACLNLNALRAKESNDGARERTNPAHKALFELIKNIEDLPLDESEEALADSVFDWVDEDSITTRSGAEEDEYLSYTIPYMTANNYFASLSELRLVKGFNPAVVEKLRPYVCVIPDSDMLKINVNTLTSDQSLLLSALIEGLSQSGAEAIISARPEAGFDTLDEFIAEAEKQGAKNLKKDDPRFAIKSEYFQLRAHAKYAELEFKMTSLLQLKDGKVHILARKFGGVQ